MVFAVAVLLALPFNLRQGIEYRDAYVTIMQAFEQDLAEGMSSRELAERLHLCLGYRTRVERHGDVAQGENGSLEEYTLSSYAASAPIVGDYRFRVPVSERLTKIELRIDIRH